MIHVEPMAGEKIRIDGDLREWPAKMTELGETVQGSATGGEPKAGVVLGYDDTSLYCVLRVTDKKLVRSAGGGASDDHATLYLAFPRGQTYEIGLFPGDPGKTPGLVKVKGAALASAKLVEAPTEKGYDIEASIPWSAFPEAARTRVGLRAAVRLTDADSPGSVKAVIATAGGVSGKGLPPLPFSAEQGLDEYLTKEKGLGSNPQRAYSFRAATLSEPVTTLTSPTPRAASRVVAASTTRRPTPRPPASTSTATARISAAGRSSPSAPGYRSVSSTRRHERRSWGAAVTAATTPSCRANDL